MQIMEIKRKGNRDLVRDAAIRKGLKAQKTRSKKNTSKLKDDKKANRKALKLASDPTQASIMQVNDLRRTLNALMAGGTHMLDTKSKVHRRAIQSAIKDIDEWMDNIPLDNGKLLVSRLKYANKLAREGFEKWGDDAFGGIDKMLKSDNPDVFNRLFSGRKLGFTWKTLVR